MIWRKSSHSGAGGNDCIELACVDTSRLVRDSKNATGHRLKFGKAGFGQFLAWAPTIKT